MANTISADLTREIVSEQVLTALGNVNANINLYSNKFDLDTKAPGATVQVPLVTGGSTPSKNRTNYESGDTTVESRPIVVDEYGGSFHVTQAQRNNGHALKSLIKIHADKLADQIQSVLMTPITSTNFGAAVLAVDEADFDKDDLKTIRAAAAKYKQKNLLLGSLAYTNIMPTSTLEFDLAAKGAYGFNSIAETTTWAGSETDTYGFVCDPQALLVGSALPAMDDEIMNALDTYEIIEVGAGLAVQFCSWASTSSRHRWASLDVMFGCGVGDKTAGKLVTVAAE